MRRRLALVAAMLVAAAVAAPSAWAPPRYANLALTLAARPTAYVGQTVRYVTRLENRGPDSALDVFVRYDLPPGTHVRRAVPSQGRCSTGGASTTCALGLMGQANQGNDAKASVELLLDAPATGRAEVSAEVYSPTLAMELVPENNLARAAVDVAQLPGARPAADLDVDFVLPKFAKLKKRFAYTVRVVNLGPDTATGVRLAGRSVGDLAVGAEARVLLRATPKRRGSLGLTAAAATTTRDLDAANNRRTASVRVR